MNHTEAREALRDITDPEIAEHSQRFFKTGKGEYGKGDKFLGIRVPNVRKVARKFKQLSLKETERLLHSDYHEDRLCALIILVNKAKKADQEKLKKIYDLYLNNTDYISNWDLVDTSAKHVQHMPRTMLRYAIEKFEENRRQYYLNL